MIPVQKFLATLSERRRRRAALAELERAYKEASPEHKEAARREIAKLEEWGYRASVAHPSRRGR
jgi:hypothetical protein